ncbi:hypothetical protein V502_00038 [Pseudogymnoascus sp. VKM F-4520 (FW-2644)]|nr:hypothetical protein V502_00038 [Pseudogymnoascus sp. VKM F-4520 (FW-2644)]
MDLSSRLSINIPSIAADLEVLLDPDLCASLHNQIIEHACLVQPSLRRLVRRNVLTIPHSEIQDRNYEPSHAITESELPDILGIALTDFLEKIDVFEFPEGDYHSHPMTPYSSPPILPNLWSFADHILAKRGQDQSNLILLYSHAQSSTSGGLFLDTNEQVANWLDLPGSFWPGNGIPLSEVLRRWLCMWEVGKFYLLGTGEFGVRSWIDKEVDQAVEAWERLVVVIEARRTGFHRSGSDDDESRLMIENGVLQRYQGDGFSRPFFAKANKPSHGLKFVAPGITTWDSTSFRAVYSAAGDNRRRARQSHRLGRVIREEEHTPMIIFPAANEIPAEVLERRAADVSGSQWMDDLIIVERKLGLYSTPGDGFGSTVTLIADVDNRACFQRCDRCPWLPNGGRMTTLKEMLEIWTVLIEMNVWKVDGNGVVGGLEWFQRGTNKRQLEDGTEVDLNLIWGPEVGY